MPRTSSSLIPGISADEETGGGQRGTVGAADDGPGDPEEGSIVDRDFDVGEQQEYVAATTPGALPEAG